MRGLRWFFVVLAILVVVGSWLGPVAVGVIVGLVVAWFVAMTVRALRIVRRRSEDLAAITGIPADMIRRDISRRQITPGEWAAQHGLDPITLQPRR